MPEGYAESVAATLATGRYTPGITGESDGGQSMIGRVTQAQVRAAQLLVERGDERERIRKIAKAKPAVREPEEFSTTAHRSDDHLTGLAQRTGRNADGTLLSGVDVVDPVTGGAKAMKPERYGLIPVWPIAELARVYGYGAEKYSSNNWRSGYRWGLSYDALQRHINAFWSGESQDPESTFHHLAHAMFHLATLMTYDREGLGTDDRA